MIGNIMERARAAVEKHMVPRQSISKASMSTTDLTTGGGLLAVQQASRFIRILKMTPNLLRACRVVPLKGASDRIDRVHFSSRILHAASENTNLGASNQSVPTTSKVEMSAKLFKAETRISYETLQDSIEGGKNVRGNSFENMIFQLIAERIAYDVEEIALLSDTGSGTTDYAQFDGWMALAEASHSYDFSGAALSKGFFKGTFLQLPKEYRQKKNDLIWVVSSNMDVEWNDELADNSYSDRATKVAWGKEKVNTAYGVPMLVSAHVPAESGTSSNLGKALITHPKNMVLGIWRNLFMEIDRDIRAGTLVIVTTMRLDAKFEQVEGAAVGTNVKVA